MGGRWKSQIASLISEPKIDLSLCKISLLQRLKLYMRADGVVSNSRKM